jgi:uncharacterized protein YfaS (alpha-2-macroglobulin family)
MNSFILKIALILSPLFLFNNTSILPNFGGNNKYEKMWAEVEKFEQDALPASALKKVEEIYAIAISEKNNQEIIKSSIYRLKYINILNDDGYVKAIQELESEIENIEGTARAFLHFLLGNMYLQYYNANSWTINQMSVTQNFDHRDMKTWDKTLFQDKLIKNLMIAIKSPELKNTKTKDYTIFISKSLQTEVFYPTLFDFLAYESIKLLQQNDSYYGYYYQDNSNSDKFKEQAFLSNATKFTKLEINADSLSRNYATLKIYQEWLGLRLGDKENVYARLFTDVQRLNFVKNNLVSSNKDAIWESSIRQLNEEFFEHEAVCLTIYELARYLNNLGNTYDHKNPLTHEYSEHNKIAHQILTNITNKYPDALHYPLCMNLKNEIETKTFSVQSERTLFPDSRNPMLIKYKNIYKIQYSIVKIKHSDYLKIEDKYDYNKYVSSVIKEGELIAENKEIFLENDNKYNTHSTEFLFDELQKGFYIIIFNYHPSFEVTKNYMSLNPVFVSDLSVITRSSSNHPNTYYVLDRKSGEPVQSARLEIFASEYDYKKRKYVDKKLMSGLTDKNGMIVYNSDAKGRYYNTRIEVSKGEDFISESSYNYYYSQQEPKAHTAVRFFTDRAIYRPGQIINFKAICYTSNNERSALLTDYSTSIHLQDVNYQNINSLQVKTNEYGSFSGSFEIPLDVLTGMFRITTTGGSHSIRVEEYKRPQFEVEMNPVEGEFRLNDSISFTGTALTYAGTALSDAKVSYSVVRNRQWFGLWRYWAPSSEPEEVAFGELKTDNDGKFTIPFKAIDPTGDSGENSYFIFSVNVNITDINGETQSGSTSVYVSNKALVLSSDIPEKVDRNVFDSLRISSANVSGQYVPANINVEIFKLKDPELLIVPKKLEEPDKKMYSKEEWYSLFTGFEYADELNHAKWESGKKVFSQSVNTENTKKILLKNINKWDPGIYRIILKSKDKWGNDIVETKEFQLFNSDSQEMPFVAASFFNADKYFAKPGEIVNIYIGSSFKDVNVVYEIIVKGDVYKREIFEINDEVRKIEFPVSEKHRGGFSVNFMFVKNARIFEFSHYVSVDWDNKRLNLELLTYRDKTLPGSQEEWKIKITDNNKKPVDAELLAGMYDASLDVFAANSWGFSYLPSYYSYLTWASSSFEIAQGAIYTSEFRTKNINDRIVYPSLNLHGLDYWGRYYRNEIRRTAGVMEKSESTVSADEDLNLQDAELEESPAGFAVVDQTVTSTITRDDKQINGLVVAGEEMQVPEVKIRSNFNETAFFYPHLVTDEKGEIMISFTMPESLTRWNFMGLAHTKDMKFGTVREQLVTQKELMIMPNMPRFFREGDVMQLSARISNVSDDDVNGKARIEFFDPISLKSLNREFAGKEKYEQNFTTKAGANNAVNWNVEIPEGISMVGVRFIAEGDKHSDGEERVFPVLTNRMLVTETMPLPVRKAGTTKFSMGRLINSGKSSTLRHHAVTLEFTSNPAWYAVQAIPYLMEYPYECAEQIFSRLYANMLASHIANSDPKIKRVFEAWKNTPDSKALLSNLEKNQELKALLLEETPWVLQAQNETERKRRVGLLFDLNRMSGETSKALKQLSDMQKYNGGWPWFDGMPESWYITQHIVSGFGKLQKLGVLENADRRTENMIQKAVSFIDGELVRAYNEMKKYCDKECMKRDNIGYMQIHYLYTRSFFKDEHAISKKTQEAFDYYLGQAAKYWTNKSFYMQGMMAIALKRYGNDTEADKIIASLKEHAIHHKELGMYWKTDRGYYWYQAPIETHAMLIEAFEEVTNDTQAVDDMKVWLLKQKQTQDWKTTKATVEAIYALLLRGTDILSNDEIAIIRLGDITIDAKNNPEIKTEAGTGYFKKAWHASEVKPEMGNVTVTKSTNDVAWGSVYWQYFEELDKITHFEETPIKIDKKLFVERRVGEAKRIVPIAQDANLKLGDRVQVRIEIRVDRDMEYVHLKDMRASCFEPVDVISGYRWKHGLGYYQAIKDASMNFFINYLQKGTYVFEYELVVTQKGDFSNGITTIQSMYAPEFTSHSEGVRVVVQ